MADNVDITAGSGTTVATDDVDLGSGVAHVQYVKLADGTDGGTALIPGTVARGLLVEPTRQSVSVGQTPTTSSHAYVTGELIGGAMSFAGVNRASGRPTEIRNVVVATKVSGDWDAILYLSSAALAGTLADTTAFDPTDATVTSIVAAIPVNVHGLPSNGVGVAPVNIPAVPAVSTLFGYLVAGTTGPTLTGSADVTVVVTADLT